MSKNDAIIVLSEYYNISLFEHSEVKKQKGYVQRTRYFCVTLVFNRISKCFTSFECRNFASRDLNFLTRLWITPFSSCTFSYFKVTKADNLNFFTFAK